ncbi:unnamed protein product [Mytilus edulis]|uniref:Uncharacterized protein n=1 Tax=Mytilus edulis TaxID=6550 RepID=A0A8S3T7B6_MYTED|nr:unnamed protein product [Mytilus edulis]
MQFNNSVCFLPPYEEIELLNEDENNKWSVDPDFKKQTEDEEQQLELTEVVDVDLYDVCGNDDKQFQYITPVSSGISNAFTNEIRCYSEGDYGATKWDTAYASTIRSIKCKNLGSRCLFCAEDRRMLRKRQQKAEEKKISPPVTFVHRTYQHVTCPEKNLVTIIEQQKTEMRTLSSEVQKLKRQLHKQWSMYEDNHKSFVGILFDKIKMQEDLVYGKTTGDLIGFCYPDSIGNEILILENLVGNCKTSQLAKCMLVIMECVKFMLDQGADFVLTYNFKQDPLKQHFGHYRHKGGANNNPSVYEVRHTMTQLRAVGA